MDKYLHYDHLELSEDPSFIRWAKGAASRDGTDWDKWLLQHPEKAQTVSKAKSLVLTMKFAEDTPKDGVENKIWRKIAAEVNTVESKRNTKAKEGVWRRLLPYAAVAAAALLFFIFNPGNNYDTSVAVSLAKMENITLPDGSTVSVNADSRLAYNKEKWDKKRVVFLEGEAFFTVKKGSKFRVKTNSGIIQVLGTSFNVYSRNDRLSVQCETGKVSVQTSGGMEAVLNPQQSVTVVEGMQVVGDITASERRSTWRDGIFVYQATPLMDVAAELERQFDVDITLDKGFNDKLYTGSFNKSNLETALMEVFYPVDLKYEINGKSVMVTK